MNLRKMKLSHRFTTVFALLFVSMTALLFLTMESYFRQTLMRNVERRSANMAEVLAAVARPHLLQYDYLTLQQVADGVVDGEEVIYAVLLDKEGRVAGFSGAPERKGTYPEDEASATARTTATTTVNSALWNDGSKDLPVMEAVVPVLLPGDGSRWGTVRLGLSLGEVSRQLGVTRILLIVFGLCGVAAASFASWFLARRITRPLQELVVAADQLPTGNWDPSFDVDAGDEIGELAQHFKAAGAALDKRTGQLETAKKELIQLNASLEDKVVERTAELQASREMYRLLVEGSPDAYCYLEGDTFLFTNATFLEIFEREASEVESGELSWMDILHPNFHEEARKQLSELDPDGESFADEWSGMASSGRAIDLEVRGRKVLYDGRAVCELLLVDVTQRKALIQQIMQNERMRSMGEMTALVAHHFNNILAIIHGRAQLVQRKVKEEKLLDSLEVIQASVLKAGEMVRHLQDYFGEQMDLRYVEIDLNRTIRDVAYYQQSIWSSVRENGAAPIRVDLDLKEVAAVRGAGPLLQDAFGRILTNAAEAMPRGGVIRVTTQEVGRFVHVVVEDEGEGMSEEAVSRAFEPFFTTKGAANRGLGLSASQGIFQRHEGRIQIESRQGEGTRVTMVLPIEARVAKIAAFHGAKDPGSNGAAHGR